MKAEFLDASYSTVAKTHLNTNCICVYRYVYEELPDKVRHLKGAPEGLTLNRVEERK